VGKDLLDHYGVLDAGYDPDRAAQAGQVSMSMLTRVSP
jgi:hypothetical protein